MKKDFKEIGSPEDKVIEECSEVIQAICKAKRFGWLNWHPDTPEVCNAELILMEWSDLVLNFNSLKGALQCQVIKFRKEHGLDEDIGYLDVKI